MQDIHRFKKILIVGGGTAGWMTAAAFAKALIPAGYEVTLVESDELGTVGVGEATIPPIKAFNSLLGFDEFDFLKSTQGTYKLGIEFVDWGEKGNRYIHPFGKIGIPRGPLPFYQYWLKYHLQDKSRNLGNFSTSVQAAYNNRFSTLGNQSKILSGMDYAFHFDAALYAKYLRKYSEFSGVERIEGLVSSVKLKTTNGFIESVILKNGQSVSADFFIDCTGFKAILSGGALGTEFEDWSDYLFCDSALAAQTTNVEPVALYTKSIACEAGWQWRIPLQHRMGNGYVYSSRHLNDELAQKNLVENLSGELIKDIKKIRFTPGLRKKVWNKNCVAIGLSAGFLEPLESTSIHLIQSSIVKFINLFPSADFNQLDVDHYNTLINRDYYLARDFIILHYKATKRSDSIFWRECQAMEIPQALQLKLEMFRKNGRLLSEATDIFKEESWVSVLLGQGMVPSDFHPLVDGLSDTELDHYMNDLEVRIKKAVLSMPDYEKFLSAYCKSEREF